MEFSVKQIAALLGGKVEGNPEGLINTIGKIQDAQPSALAFLANPKYEPYIYETRAGAVLVGQDFVARKELNTTLIRVDDPYICFTRLLEEYSKAMKQSKHGIEQPSFLHETVKYGSNLYLGAFAYVDKNVTIGDNVKIYPQVHIGENVKIGADSIIYPGAKIYAGTEIGSNCTIHAGAIIGSDGFGFAPTASGEYKNIPQLGIVQLEDHVSIGANTTIDRATMVGDKTWIGEGAKLDNLIQIAHNVTIGKNTVIAAQTGISGSSSIGDNCMIGGQVGIAGHLEIADGTLIGAQSGINRSLKEKGQKYIGTPVLEFTQFFKAYAIFRKLPDLYMRLSKLEQETAQEE
ncbi:MAG: UDP-3-O-(3-hydroxymyristoyl)glucosamine N-acyltransferase [Cyclobacteriaceae bacterium]|nr:UDP-3-O-(3-hydroxymyristoyl)glucosamine N-acyltransferase [Cyclobacteriaceae bacterium]